MERVEVGVGSAIGMGWKRRSRARSLDIVLRYSSASVCVVWWVRSWRGTGGGKHTCCGADETKTSREGWFDHLSTVDTSLRLPKLK